MTEPSQRITTEQLAELRRLHDEDGMLWTSDHDCVSAWIGDEGSDDCDGFNFYMGGRASLAVAARNALPALLDEIERLRNERSELFLSQQVAKMRAERDAAIAKCEQLAAERPISEDMYDYVVAENERASHLLKVAKVAVKVGLREYGDLPDGMRDAVSEISRAIVYLAIADANAPSKPVTEGGLT